MKQISNQTILLTHAIAVTLLLLGGWHQQVTHHANPNHANPSIQTPAVVQPVLRLSQRLIAR